MKRSRYIWIDFENAPHVWVLKELIGALKDNGFSVLVTARNFSSTIALCRYMGIEFREVDCPIHPKARAGKLLSIIWRGLKLRNYIKRSGLGLPLLAVSHGSRSQALASGLLGTTVFSLDDYEHSFTGFNRFVDRILSPAPIKPKNWGKYQSKVINYPGLKENLYLWNGNNLSDGKSIPFKEGELKVLFRPESPDAHYASKKSEVLQEAVMKRLCSERSLHVVLFPRNISQGDKIKKFFSSQGITCTIPSGAINGPALISSSDLVIGGGGTMTREAAVLGVPSYTFFAGKLGEVDRYLIHSKRLVLLESEEDVAAIDFATKKTIDRSVSAEAFEFVLNYLLTFLQDQNVSF